MLISLAMFLSMLSEPSRDINQQETHPWMLKQHAPQLSTFFR